jgi:hypothetical protein
MEKPEKLGMEIEEIDFVTIKESKALKELKASLRKTFLPRTKENKIETKVEK